MFAHRHHCKVRPERKQAYAEYEQRRRNNENYYFFGRKIDERSKIKYYDDKRNGKNRNKRFFKFV